MILQFKVIENSKLNNIEFTCAFSVDADRRFCLVHIIKLHMAFVALYNFAFLIDFVYVL